MQTHTKREYPGKTCVAILPKINLNPSDETCIYSTLMFIQDQSEKHNKSVPCVTFDQTLWLKATKIIQEKGLPIVCRLGGFHARMSFLGSMGTIMKASGLAESFETVYGGPTARQMFRRKPVSQALCGHFLVEAVLMTKLLRHLLQRDYIYFQEVHELLKDEEQDNEAGLRDIEFNEDDDLPNAFPNDLTHEVVIEEADTLEMKKLYELFISENDSIENVNKSEALSKLFNFLQKYKDRLALRSGTARLWIQYLEYVTIVKNFIRTERTGNWHLYLVSRSQMLNRFAATGHINYVKSARM